MDKFKIISTSPGMREMVYQLFQRANHLPLQVLTPDSDKPLVIHERTAQMTYVSKGKGKIVLQNIVHEIQEGDLVIFEAGVSHSFACREGELHLLHWHWPEEGADKDRVVIQEPCDLF